MADPVQKLRSFGDTVFLCVSLLTFLGGLLLPIPLAQAADTTPPSAPGQPKEGSITDLDYDTDGTYTVYWNAASDPESGITTYEVQEKVGSAGTWKTLTGTWTSTSINLTGRLHGNQYFYQVRAKNGAGLWGGWSGTSNGITVDTTAPSAPGKPTEGSTVDLDYDGDGAYTVYWGAASDGESGISSYEIQEKKTATGTWTTLATTSSTKSNVSSRLDKTKYFYRVRAKNKAGIWGSWSSESDGILIDKTAPSKVTVTDDGATTSSTTTLHARWTTSSDAESGVVQYQYLIKRDSSTGAIVVNWTVVSPTPLGLPTEVTHTGLSLVNGITYFVGVRAKNGAALFSSEAYSDGITVQTFGDTTPPSGSIQINSGASYTSTTSVTLSLSSTDNSGTVSQMIFSNDGTTYSTPEAYAATKSWSLASGNGTKTVYAKFKDSAGNWSNPVSDSIVLDTTPPSTPAVTDDGATTSSTTQLHATWTASSDAGSGISDYQYQIRESSATGLIIRDWTSVGLTTEVTATSLNLTKGKSYTLGVEAKNGAGLYSSAGLTDGITVDLPPNLEITSPHEGAWIGTS